MKRIGKSKEPTVRQMLNMASNLQKKFNKYSSITVAVDVFSSGSLKLDFHIYISGIENVDFSTWPKLQTRYFKLMRSK